MRFRSFFLFVFLSFISCSEQEVRKPISSSKTHTLLSTVKALKEINKIEEAKIENYIKKDSLHDYIRSSNGFWYQYINKIELDTITPKKGDLVKITYDFLDLNNLTIYTKEENSIREYRVDEEDFIPALQIGIKLMKVGETIKFIIPSYNAYGLLGDERGIGINQSIISRVTLININK